MHNLSCFPAHLKTHKICATKPENAIYEEIQSQRPPPQQLEMQTCPAYHHVNTPSVTQVLSE